MPVGFIDIVLSAKPSSLIDGMKQAQEEIAKTEKAVEDGKRLINASLGEIASFSRTVASASEQVVRSIERNMGGTSTVVAEEVKKIAGAIGTVAEETDIAITSFGIMSGSILGAADAIAEKFPKAATTIAKLAGPFSIVISAASVLYGVVTRNFEALSEGARRVTNGFIRLYNNSIIFRTVVESLRSPLETSFRILEGIGTAFKAIELKQFGLLGPIAEKTFSDVDRISRDAFARIKGGDIIPEIDPDEWKTRISDPVADLLGIIPKIEVDDSNIQKYINDINNEIQDATPSLKFNVEISDEVRILNDLNASLNKINSEYQVFNDESERLNDTQRALKQALLEAAEAGFEPQSTFIQSLLSQYRAVNSELEVLAINSQNVLLPTTESLRQNPTTQEATNQRNNLNRGLRGLENVDLVDNDAVNKARENIRLLKEEIIAQQAVLSDTTASEAQRKAAGARVEQLRQEMETEKARANVSKQATQTLFNETRQRIKAYIAEGIAASIRSALGTGPAGIILAGVAGATAAGLFSSLVPKLADGGVITGPTFALLGEYGGAFNNPEIAAPESKLIDIVRKYSGRGSGSFSSTPATMDIYGNRMRAFLDRTNEYSSRLR